MPRLTQSLPKYRFHRASKQAVVTLDGDDYYLGPHGTKASRLEYDRLIAEWLANGRRMPAKDSEGHVAVMEVLAAYKRFAEGYYVKNGTITAEVGAIVSAMRIVKRLYGKLDAAEFGPLKLQAVQQSMIAEGWARKSINKQLQRVVRIFSWAESKEMVPKGHTAALREVSGLHQGRTTARESAPVLPVADEIVQQTLHHLPAIVADMVRLQRMTGARPDEICSIRPCDLDTSGDVWAYTPESHKTQHHGKRRVIFIGPRAQAVLRPYLLRSCESYCFSPADSERKRRRERHESRVTPLAYGNGPGTNRKGSPKRRPGTRYTSNTYRVAIVRGCELAFGMPDELRVAPRYESADAKAARLKKAGEWREKHCWSPNQLRHSAATAIRKQFGLEGAQVTLGHSHANTSEIYAERDHAKAAAIMAEVG